MGDNIPGEILMQLGGLLKIAEMQARDIQDIKREQSANAVRAETDRSSIKAEIIHLANRITAVETGQIALQTEQKEMKEVTDNVTSWKHMGTGAAAVIAFLAGLGGWVLSRFWDRLFGP